MKTHIPSPVSLIFLWAWCSSFPPAHGTVPCPNPGPSAADSPALESLECRSDYLTHIRCSWTDVAGLPLSLFHLDEDEHRVSACVPGPPTAQNASGVKRSQCRYNTSLFAIGFNDVFFFSTPHAQGLSGSVKLGNITADWTDVQIISGTSTTQSGTFTARASDQTAGEPRAGDRTGLTMTQNPGPDHGVNVMRSTGALPGPFNLQCVYDGEREVKCKWQMMKELAQYIIYNLSYHTDLNTSSELCCPGLDGDGEDDDDDEDGDGDDDEDDDDDEDNDDIMFSCSFSAPEAETLLLNLHPQPKTKVFQSHKHIEPPAPVDMRVELMGEDWVLNWTLPKYRTVPITSEFRYWSRTSPELAVRLRLPPGVSGCVMAERSLTPSTSYFAQVRCSVSPQRGQGSRYRGGPSDWTKPVHWTTRAAPASVSVWMYFLLSVSVIVALIIMYFSFLVFRRRCRVWEASLPSPFQSKLMETLCQVHAEELLCYVEPDDPCLDRVCVLEDVPLGLHKLDRDDVSTLHAAYCHGPPNHYTYQEGSVVSESPTPGWHCPSSPPPSEDTGFKALLSLLASASQTTLQPCSEGYQ